MYPLKTVADVVVSNVDKHSVDGQRAVKLCNYTDVYNNTYIDSSLDFMNSTASEEQIKRYTLRLGDVILTKDSETPLDIAVPALITENIPDLVCGYHLAVVRPNLTKITPRFLLRALQATTTASYFTRTANGITRYGLTYYSLKNAPIPVPSLPTQDKIVHFLDRETAEADALVAKYERLTELLEEKRIALITQAVTKGLDQSVSMKDSGIEWIGAIPDHWTVLPVRRFAKSVETGGTPPESDFSQDGIAWYTPGDFHNEIDLSESEKRVCSNAASTRFFPKGSVLVVGIGATLGKVGLPPSESTSNQQCNAIILDNNIKARFLAYALVACNDEMRSRASASTLPILNQSKTKALELPIPPLVEQEHIASWIDRRVVEIGTLVEKTKAAIALVQEHRSALITSAVTGQINVKTYRSMKHPVEVPA